MGTGTSRAGRADPEETVALLRIPRQPGPADLRRSPAPRPAPDARSAGRPDAAPDPGHTAVRTPHGAATHTSWTAPETPAGDPTHDPHEVTVQMDAVQLGGIRLSPAAGTERPTGRDDGPVFVDESGRRSRRYRRLGMLLGLACAGYAVVILATLLSGSSDAPWIPVPHSEEEPAGRVDEPPVPAESTRPSAGPSGSPDAGPSANDGTAPAPGAGARTTGSPAGTRPTAAGTSAGSAGGSSPATKPATPSGGTGTSPSSPAGGASSPSASPVGGLHPSLPPIAFAAPVSGAPAPSPEHDH
ncbi:hypothetical protein ACFW1F_32350 [Streptomyces bungoensis]|uniref:hypothetical protein n=1 Tax=Streptomyces bungoensis TaxID=285568 RepID=UPI0036AABA45